MARKIEVQITGDSTGLKAAFDDSARGARQFNGTLNSTTEELRRLGRTGGPRFWRQLTAGALGGAANVFALSQALDQFGKASEKAFGEEARATQFFKDTSSAFESLVHLDVVGFFEATINATESAGVKAREHAAAVAKQEEELTKLRVATEAVEFITRKYNNTIVDGIHYLVAFKGAVDDLARGPRVAEIYGDLPAIPARPVLRPLSPSQRRELGLIGVEGTARIPGLQNRLRQLNNQLRAGNLANETRLRISENIRNTEAEIAGIYKTQAAAQRAAAREAAERARRAREAAAEAEQARQLRVIAGPIPTPANLRRQLEQLQARIRGGDDVPRGIKDRLLGISRLLRDDVTPETREAIRDYFRMVRGEFDKGAAALPRQVQLSKRLLGALGFTPTGQRMPSAARAGAVAINGPITVVADNPDVFLRELQKKAGRTTATARGRSPGQSLGLS